MLGLRVFKWVTGTLLLACLGLVVLRFITISSMPDPDRVVSVTPLGDGAAVYEILYDSGGATVPFIYRYYVFMQLKNEESVLEEVRRLEPFLVATSSGAVKDIAGRNVSLEVKGTIYEFKTLARYRVNDEVRSIRFSLNGH